MSENRKELVEDLESIIRLLADVWPTDRDNLPEAGAKFEQLAENFEKDHGQLKKLVDLSWQGLIHLFQKDDYFMMVKAATMQAINTIREYILQDGNIKVEEFEKAFEELEKSLEGGAESADEIIELDEAAIQAYQNNSSNQDKEQESDQTENPPSLDDLATFFMSMDEDAVSDEQLKNLSSLLQHIISSLPDSSSKPLQEAFAVVEQRQKNKHSDDWLETISLKIEKAIEIQAEGEWESVEKDEEEIPETEAADTAKSVSEEIFIIPDDIDTSLIGEFVTECSDHIQMAESALLDLEESPGDEELINTIFRAFHTIKGTSAFMGLDPLSEFTHFVETFLSLVREGEIQFDAACADISLESIDIINKMLAVVEHSGAGDPLPIPAGFTGMINVLNTISENNLAPAKALDKEGYHFSANQSEVDVDAEYLETQQAEDSNQAPSTSSGSPKNGVAANGVASKSETEASVRVSVGRLDKLIDMVGELVIAHSVVAQDASIPRDSDLQKKVNHATKILRELQDTSLTLRMVPLKATFQKMNRLVRDLSRKAGKQVRFTTAGDETEIDRNMVDIINEPLIHMLRNSLDHGVETPEERKRAGKEDTATIQLSASQEGGKVVIKITDDGRGINKDKILKKAIEKGLVDPEKKLTEKEIYNLIFLPGFSSAEKVTDLSGRGVGMDVVRRSIESLQGKVDVTSELDKGTIISIELPFTLAITDGMVVRVGEDRFIIPTINIDMTFRAQAEDIFTVMGNQEQVAFRGYTVPVLRLHRLFDISGAVEDLTQGTLLLLKNNGKRYALMVDEVIGQQQLVGKSINIMAKMDHISGGAIMGDGRVGLILDTATLTNWSANTIYN